MSISLFSVCSIYIYYFKYLLIFIISTCINNNGFLNLAAAMILRLIIYTTCTCVFDRMKNDSEQQTLTKYIRQMVSCENVL